MKFLRTLFLTEHLQWLLVYKSCHPKHVKTSVAYGQVLCIERLRSIEEGFKRDIQELMTWSRAKGSPERPIDQQGDKVMQKSLLDQIQSKNCGLP